MARILLIDDDYQFRNMLRQVLERANYQVVEASDGSEGTRLYTKHRFELVITDLIMPQKEGIETISELKKMDPDIKIIAISGGGRIGPDSYLHFAEKLGAKYTFAKPVDRKEILDAIHHLLENSF